jgi:hypothetical protein
MDYPGNLGYWHRGAYVLGIHADWPAYPGQGAGDALYELCQFPGATVFQPIDSIDLCTLFVASGQAVHSDVWSKNAFHVAIWHSDLIELADEMLIDGIITPEDIAFRRARRDKNIANLCRDLESQGAVISGEPPDLYVQFGEDRHPVSLHYSQEEMDELVDEFDAFSHQDHVIFDPQSSVRVASRGWAELERLLQNEPILSRFERLQKLIDLEMYDTAIRDAGAALETALREAAGTSKYGVQLVDIYVKKLENDQRYTDASVKRFRTDLRTAFKFIRNGFAHRIVDVPQDRALALLVRFAALIESVKESALLAPPLSRERASFC